MEIVRENVCTDQFIPGTSNYLASWTRTRDTKVNEIEGSTLWEGRYIFFVFFVGNFFFELEYLSTTGENNFASFVKKSMRFHERLENTLR